MRVKETIRHGGVHDERIVDIGELTGEAVARMLRESPYPMEMAGDDERACRVRDELAGTGVSDFGWADYEVVE